MGEKIRDRGTRTTTRLGSVWKTNIGRIEYELNQTRGKKG